MLRTWFLIIACFCAVTGVNLVFAQPLSEYEPGCLAGNPEACYWTGYEYAKGDGVPVNHKTAIKYYLLSCENGIAKGCQMGGDIYFYGDGDIPVNKPVAINIYEAACRMGNEDSCQSIDIELKKPEFYDIARLIPILEAGCAEGVSLACASAAFLLYDGRQGKYPGHVDHIRAAPLIETSCSDPKNIYKGANLYCTLAESLFANPDSIAFDATKGIYYTALNCDLNRAGACSNLGLIYHTIEDWPLAITAYERACQLDAQLPACQSATTVKQYLAEVKAYETKMAERKAAMDNLLGDGKYGAAVNMALYQFGSVEHAQMAALAANSAGRMSDISTQDLYALASWFSHGPVRSAADNEMAKRGTGLEGTFGTGTNQAGAADARWKQQYGSSALKPASSSYAPNRPSVLSSSEAAKQTREKYRTAHCTMTGNANRNLCR